MNIHLKFNRVLYIVFLITCFSLYAETQQTMIVTDRLYPDLLEGWKTELQISSDNEAALSPWADRSKNGNFQEIHQHSHKDEVNPKEKTTQPGSFVIQIQNGDHAIYT